MIVFPLDEPDFVTRDVERITARAGEMTFARVGTSVEYASGNAPAIIVFHAELDSALLTDSAVNFTWFKDFTEVTQLSFFSEVYTSFSDPNGLYSLLFIRVGEVYPITGTYSCLIENNVGMQIVQSHVCESFTCVLWSV